MSRGRIALALGVAITAAAAIVLLIARERARTRQEEATRPPLPVVAGVEMQPLRLHARRVAEALARAGAPLPADDERALERARSAAAVQAILDRRVLFGVRVDAQRRVDVSRGAAHPELDEDGWRAFLVKVINEPGATAELRMSSPQAEKIRRVWKDDPEPEPVLRDDPDALADRWLELELAESQHLPRELSGLAVEYRVALLHCADRTLGESVSARDPRRMATVRASEPFQRAATFRFDLGPGTRDGAGGGEIDVLFRCRPAVTVPLRIRDENGQPSIASIVVTDDEGRTYPAKNQRLAPDLPFQPQVYRRDGETLRLPPGRYAIEWSRGPEHRTERRTIDVAMPRQGAVAPPIELRLERWIDPARLGWISGDHHVHAAGCAHYDDPTQGVWPEDMWRHMLGEDLRFAAVLAWRPCFYFQRQFWTGADHALSTEDRVMRYDVEVSRFGSHHAGHLVLLGLRDHDLPESGRLEDWPTLGLHTLRWAKAQGALTGVAHTGWGLAVEDDALPSYAIPECDGIGGNELVVQLAQELPDETGRMVPAVDFVSAVDTPHVWELSVWYHALNAGFRTRLAGESDWPCIYEDRIGAGRSYVKIDGAPRFTSEAFRSGLRAGRAYVSDGRSHLLEFRVDDVAVGEDGSELALGAPRTVRATARVAAMLPERPDGALRDRPYDEMPYWHVERARIGDTRRVAVELVVNGEAAGRREIEADGTLHDVAFDVRIERSSWIALRVLPSSHTNPIFAVVSGRTIRASRRSVEWLARMVDVCWAEKEPHYAESEREAARAAYEHARRAYRRILAETPEAR